jgi:hypothetical protein
MKHVPFFDTNDKITTSLFQAIILAIKELQGLAITSVKSPLQLAGQTLLSTPLSVSDIEFGIPTADIVADSDTVTLQPCDIEGVSYTDADTVTLYVAPDRSEQPIGDLGWVATDGEVTGTILSFIRFDTEGDDAEGVLVGCLLPDVDASYPFPARLEQEAAGGNGEYDVWTEQEVDSDGVYKDKAGGRTETTTGMSLWESNNTEGIFVNATTGVVVSVRLETGDNDQLSFEYERMQGDGGDAGVRASGDVDEWIVIENDGRIVRGKHYPPSVLVYDCGDTDGCAIIEHIELDELGHVILVEGIEGNPGVPFSKGPGAP